MAAAEINLNHAVRIRRGKGFLPLAMAAWLILMSAGGAALAQDGMDGDMGDAATDGGYGDDADGGAGYGDSAGYGTGYGDEASPGDPGPADPGLRDSEIAGTDTGAGDGAGSSDPSATGGLVTETVEDDGIVGLIEAPEDGSGLDGALIAPGSFPDSPYPDAAGGPGMASFAQVQPRARMIGPIGLPPVVVELFTSQGCSSCPPADEMLADLADRDDVLALSWHVDYWDYLGWKDQFAQPQFTRRQQAYAHAWGERAIYTPQVIVGGRDTLIALRPAELMALLQAQMARPAEVMVSSRQLEGGYRIELTPRAPIPGRVAIILVRYAPSRSVAIKAGENRGVKVEYRNIVLAAERIAEWDGRGPLGMTVRPGARGLGNNGAFPNDTRHAILVQDMDDRSNAANGPVLAAIRLD